MPHLNGNGVIQQADDRLEQLHLRQSSLAEVPSSVSRAIQGEEKPNDSTSELAKRLVRLFLLINDKDFFAISEAQVNKMAALFSEFANQGIIGAIEKNNHLTSAINQPQALAEYKKRAQILSMYKAIFQGQNPLYCNDPAALQKMTQATLELLLFTPSQIKKIAQQFSPGQLSGFQLALNLTEAILLEASLIHKQLRAQVLKPLEDEYQRLENKQAAASADKKASYEGRMAVFNAAIVKTKEVLLQYERNKNPESCKAGLVAGLTALRQSPELVKYQPYEQFLRKLLNAAALILTGVLPGLIKYAATGSLFFSVEGKSKDAAKEVFEQTQKLQI